MKRLTMCFSRLFLVVLLPVFMTVSTQAQELSRDEYDVYAKEQFDGNNYSKAIEAYEKLISIYPKEASYNYFLGRSYLITNSNLEGAITTLKIAASKNYTPDVHYYLAMAYYEDYQFDEAEISLLNFKNLSKKKIQKELNPDALQASIVKAREELYMVQDLKVISSVQIASSQIDGVYSNHVKGKFLKKPDAFMAGSDKSNDYQGVMYQPRNPQNGYEYYISSYGENGSNGKDIYKVKQLTFMDFSLPTSIGEVNTSSNEEYPYFDKASQTLFFSSDRIGGLGGYDIYFSKYDLGAESFTEPKRMGFPVNSAYDDFLYVPDSIQETAIFLSNRLNSNEGFTAYKIKNNESPKYVLPKSTDELKQIAQLEVEAPTEAPVVIEPLLPVHEAVVFTEYDLLLQQAMSKQLHCDSMQTALNAQKNNLRVTEDINERRVLIATISETEERLDTEQSAADALFIEAQRLSQPQVAEVAMDDNPTITVEKEIDGLKVYSYLPSEQYAELAAVNMVDFNTNDVNSGLNNEVDIFNFEILSASPYDEKVPIPDRDELTEGLVYRIQLGAFGKKLPMNTFGGLSPVSAEIIEERNLTKYYVGYFASSKDAHNALDEVKDYGFGDAFVVPYYRKEKITINDAREIEFGQKLDSN